MLTTKSRWLFAGGTFGHHNLLGDPSYLVQLEQTQCCMTTSIKQKERVGGSLVVNPAGAVVESVTGCVTVLCLTETLETLAVSC